MARATNTRDQFNDHCGQTSAGARRGHPRRAPAAASGAGRLLDALAEPLGLAGNPQALVVVDDRVDRVLLLRGELEDAAGEGVRVVALHDREAALTVDPHDHVMNLGVL